MEACHGVRSATVDPAVRRAEFTALYDQHVGEVYRFVHQRCHDRTIAEDVTQDTFLTAVRTIENATDIGIGWLIQVARHRMIDVVVRRARYTDKLRLIGAREVALDAGDGVAEQLRVREALAHLDVEQRLVLTLHYMDGMTIAALAEQWGRSPKAVEALVTRARRSLRRELETNDV